MSKYLRQYWPGAPTKTEKDLPDLHGRVFIVTGGTGGIGQAVATALFHANASRVYILGRSDSAGKDAINIITNSDPPGDMKRRTADGGDEAIKFLYLDLSDLQTIKPTAEAFLSAETRLDVLWHNAGVMAPPEGSVSKQGHELSFATNVLGPFLLQHFLTPILLQTAKNNDTVVTRGSVRTCWAASVEFPDPPGEDGILWDDWELKSPQFSGLNGRVQRYVQSKWANAILASEMAKRYPQLVSVSFNPGAIRTDLTRHAPGILKKVQGFLSYPVRFGALTELQAGFGSEVAERNGCYLIPWGKIGKMIPKVAEGIEKGGSGERLWNLCDGLVKEFY
ncbi:short-chain dehydrogenase/reductase [Trichoderma parareesei]|uniref:Short-chain dehydrogenase/reductase n=1 Tax=Trichoderma parareesei TaxID=858221 RepID=A0A2H2ZU49_TRIPA|nr:short-chain dehydrogenase/reductase [Trichoderma parareesei]